MFTKNKIFFSLSQASLIAFSASLSISCQKKEDEKVSMFIPFVENAEKKSFNAVKEIVNRFNDSLENDYKANKIILRNDFDKKEINSKLVLELNIRDYRTPSIVMSFPSIVPVIKNSGRLVDLTNISNNSGIPKNVLDYNKRLGFDNKGKIYNLPLGMSSEILIINKVLLSYVLSKLYKHNKEKKIDNQNIKNAKKSEVLKDLIKDSDEDPKWAELSIEFKDDEIKKWDLDLGKKDLFDTDENFDKLCDLIAKSLTIKKNNKTNIDILYTAHVENYIYEKLFKKAGSNFEKFALGYDKNYDFDYFKLFGENSKGNKDFRQTIKDFYLGLKNNIIKTPETKLKDNESLKTQIFSIVTTRVYQSKDSMKFFAKHQNDLIIRNAPSKNNDKQDLASYFMQGLFLSAIKSDIKKKNEVTNKFLTWFYDAKNILKWKFGNIEISATPAEYLAFNLSYIFPTENFKKVYKNIDLKDNKVYNFLLENIYNPKMIPFTDLVDDKNISSKLRRNIKIYINKLLIPEAKKQSDEEKVLDDFMNQLHHAIE